MGKNTWNLILRLWVCIWLPVCRADCPYMGCFCNGRIVSCTDRNLQALPQLVNTNTGIHWSLDVSVNSISRIPGGSLPPNLTDIDLDENPISTIDDTAFDDSTSTLAKLFFSGVRFTRFPNAFGHLRALSYLSIAGGNITDWNDAAWTNIGQTLQTLDLENVGITEWPSFIRHCTQLGLLIMTQNSFSSIPDGALDSIAHSLTRLSLNGNRLTMVPKAISKLNNLQSLYLQDNHITDIQWLPQNSKLGILSLSYNYIWNASQLTEVLRPYGTSMNSFDIDNNHLTSIPDISYMVNVRTLRFTNNRISDPLSGAVASNIFMLELYYNSLPYVPTILSQLLLLTTIALSNNAIRAIRETDFHRNTSIIELDYNLITEVTDTSFPDNFALRELNLNNNPLTRMSSVALQNLPSLKYLDLSNTKLTRLPLGFQYLRSLVLLDLTSSNLLVCTCAESSLRVWVMNLNPEKVHGNCGQTGIYDFFSVLSPLCPALAKTTL